MFNNKIEKNIMDLLQIISSSKYNTYLVGGCLRDLILGYTPKDLDILVEDEIDAFSKFLSKSLNSKIIKFQNHGFETFRIINSKTKLNIDITKYSKGNDGLINDLSMRDFTINSMALNLNDEKFDFDKILDPFNGLQDLNNKIIRYVSKDLVLNDPLRLLRSVRLASKLNFNIEEDTKKHFMINSEKINFVSYERIRDEIIAIFSLNNSSRYLVLMEEMNLLNQIFPEIILSKGVIQEGLHDKDVYMHSLATLFFIENIVNENLFPEIDLTNDIFAHENTIIPYIKLAAFFHDIGKPNTKSFSQSRIRFISHEDYGSKISENITTRLKFSLKVQKYIACLIKNHLRLGHLISLPDLPSDKAIRKLTKDCDDVINELVYLDFADYLATSENNFNNYLDHYNDLRKIYFRIMKLRSDKNEKYDKIIDGNEIMEIFGLNEGPEVGRVLNAIQDDIINNGMIKKSDAIKLAKQILNN
ncbi:MAG: hypothetical protein CL723_02220 [Chloroflexi bacterium]|nr:hypothetical protein [Chloroflexota bacterium]|tara:strand:+ start:17349 stop:18767 length:1419 start_codon:yes stop_codon:yes gene_type:complete